MNVIATNTHAQNSFKLTEGDKQYHNHGAHQEADWEVELVQGM